MKINYISTSTIPSYTANSIQVMKMCQAMIQNGYDTTLFTIPGNLRTDIWKHYGIYDRFPIRYININKRFRGYDFPFKIIFHSLLKRSDLFYTRDITSAALLSNFGLNTILELHDIPKGHMAPYLFKLLLKNKNIKQLVSISDSLRKTIINKYNDSIFETAIVVAPDGVDLERFPNKIKSDEARARIGIEEKFTVGYSGHFYKGRGIELIFDIAKSLPYIQFLLMGGSPDKLNEIDFLIKEREINNIKLTGFINNADLPIYLLACDILIMPYQKKVAVSGNGGDTVNFMSPMKLFEYMATGRLIISSNLPVLREILNDNNSVLCDPENLCEWKSALENVYKNPEIYAKKGMQAKKDVEQYSWQNRVKHILDKTNIQ